VLLTAHFTLNCVGSAQIHLQIRSSEIFSCISGNYAIYAPLIWHDIHYHGRSDVLPQKNEKVVKK
jgi:hypothetical protein